jgi:poly(hydroxyalkanoate) granule-associated protein
MAGKKNTEKEGSSWIGKVEDYSRKIWLAGLGVYSKIDTDGSKLFDTLVKDGEKAEKLTKSAVGKKVDAAKDSASSAKSRISGVKDRALGKWDELEGAFDKRLNSAISRLGVPSRNEVKALHSKVDTLTKQIEKLTGAKVAPVAAKTAAAKPAAKSAAKPLAKAAAKPAANQRPKLPQRNLQQPSQRPRQQQNQPLNRLPKLQRPNPLPSQRPNLPRRRSQR